MAAPLLVYVRVSKVGDREDSGRFRSPREQEERARRHATDKGHAVFPEPIVDLDVSGGTHPRDRPGMALALEEIRSGRAGGIVAYSIDRLSRDPTHGDWLIREVTSHGGVLAAPDMPDDISSPTGEFTFSMLLGVARLYRRTAGERFKLAQDNAVREGIPHGPVPYGYRQLPDRRIEPDPEQAPVVLDIFESRILGEGWGSIARRLAETTGRRWSRRGLSHLVENPLYRTGRLRVGEVESEVDSGSIVDDVTWYAAQRPRQTVVDRSRSTWLLAGLLRCSGCGHTLRPWRSHRPGNTADRYRCNEPHCPRTVSVLRWVVEEAVTSEAFRVSGELQSLPAPTVDLAPLEAALGAAQHRFDVIQSPESMDALGSDWPARVKEYRLARDAAATALGLERLRQGSAPGQKYSTRLGHVWDDLEPDQQRQALRSIFAEVRVLKVPRLAPPSMEFVLRPPHSWRLHYEPPELHEL